MKKTLIIIGAGSHSSVVIQCANSLNFKIKCIIDFNSKSTKNEKKYGIPVKDKSYINKIKKKSLVFLAIGNNSIRKKFFELHKNKFQFINLISKSSQISKYSILGKGNYVGPNVIINAGAIIKDNCILNTSSIIEHDVTIGNNVHICPSVAIGGNSTIGDQSFIGLGSNIINNIEIGKNVTLGAGSLVIKELKSNHKYYGVPAKKK